VIRLLLDQGLPRSTADYLPRETWDVVHVWQCGLSTASDRDIIAFARVDQRVICSHDADFHALLAVSRATSPTIIRVRREGLRAPDLAALLEEVWRQVGTLVATGALVTVTERSIRVRKLPIVRT